MHNETILTKFKKLYPRKYEILPGGGQNKYEIIDYLKGFSILTIVLMHLLQMHITELPSIVRTASSIGGSGVHVFLLCSGFGLYYSYMKRKINFIEFIKRRFKKIYIPYVIVILVSALFPFMYKYSDKVLAVLSHVFLFKMFIPKYEQSFGGQLWYMSTIIQFYLAFIPLCKLKEKYGTNKFLMGTFLTSVLWWILIAVLGLESERVWSSFFLQYLWEFSLGMCIANYLYNGSNIVIRTKYMIPTSVICLSITVAAVLAGGIFTVFNDVTSLIGYSGIALTIYMITWLKPVKKLIMKISTFSYEWYLIHILVFSCVFYVLAPAGSFAQLIVGLIAFG